jgi:hypothetical protein
MLGPPSTRHYIYPVAYWRRHGPGKKQLGECPGLHGTPRQRGIIIFGSWSTWPEGGGFAQPSTPLRRFLDAFGLGRRQPRL